MKRFPPRGSQVKIKPFLIVALGLMLVVAIAAAIIIVPAEVMFYLKEGKWYRYNDVTAPTNQVSDFQLYRKPFSIQKKLGVVRILTIGGSTTYGFGLRGDQAWPSRLESKLNKNFPEKFEVINLAYLGGHLEAFISDFNHVSRIYIPRDKWLDGLRPAVNDLANWGWGDLNPDVVIVVPIVNDTAPDFNYFRSNGNEFGLRHLFERGIEYLPLLKRFAVTYYLKMVVQKNQLTKSSFRADETLINIGKSYKDNLKTFVSLWGTDKKILLLGLPWLFSKEDSDHEVNLAKMMWGVTDQKELIDELTYFPQLEQIEIDTRATVKKEHGVESLINFEVGRKLKSLPYKERLRFYLDPIHVTAEGHELFADEIYDLVVAKDLALQKNGFDQY